MKKKILVKGPAMSRSGYGEQTRFALRALKQREDLFDIFLINITWGQTGHIPEDSEEKRWIDNLLKKTIFHHQSGGGFDISLQVTIPNEFEKIAPVNIGYTAGIETNIVSPQWVQKAWLMDHIIVVSNHSKQVYEDTELTAHDESNGTKIEDISISNPIEGFTPTGVTSVSYPVRQCEISELDLDLTTDFNFLTVAQWGPRKNLRKTVQWFVDEFKDEENVGLIIKANFKKNCVMDRAATVERLENILQEYEERKCKIYLVHGDMSEEDLAGLYNHPKVKSYLTLTHGEGFGLPIFEAAYNGLPVIAPGWSGQCDYLFMPTKSKKGKVKNKAMFSDVNYEMRHIQQEAVWDGVLQKESMWCYPVNSSFRNCVRDVYKDHGRFLSQAKKLQKWILENFTEEQKYKEFTDCIVESCEQQQEVEEVVVL